jgi:heat shock protein HslJ
MACAGCPSARYELNLFPDDSFHLRTTRPGRPPVMQDDLGSWVFSSDRRMLILRTSKGVTSVFAIRDGSTLRAVEADGVEPRSAPASDLRREAAFKPLDLRVTVSGAFVRGGDRNSLVECSTGQSWTIAGESPVRISPASPASSIGNAVGTFVTASGRLQSSRNALDMPMTFVVERLEPSTTGGCPVRFASLPLAGTYWKLTALGPTPVAVAPGTRNEPSITFRDEARTFSGTGGCNRLAGRYQIGPDTLLMIPAGTMMACAAGGEHEAAFGKALAATRRYVILGTSLELFDGSNTLVARFEGRP